MIITPRLARLMTYDELRERAVVVDQFKAPNHDPNCTKNHLVLRFAYKMMGSLSWHVIKHPPCPKDPTFKFAQSTLSMEGLKDWGLL